MYVSASMPIRCVVEHVNGSASFEMSPNDACDVTSVENDAFAILPVTTSICDLVTAALTKLGYSNHDLITAKGRFAFEM